MLYFSPLFIQGAFVCLAVLVSMVVTLPLDEFDTIISEPEQLNLEGGFQSLAADISEVSNLPETNGKIHT